MGGFSSSSLHHWGWSKRLNVLYPLLWLKNFSEELFGHEVQAGVNSWKSNMTFIQLSDYKAI